MVCMPSSWHRIATHRIQIKYKYLLFIECVDFMESFDNSFQPFHPKQIFICFFFLLLFSWFSFCFFLSHPIYLFSFKPFFSLLYSLCFVAKSVGNFCKHEKENGVEGGREGGWQGDMFLWKISSQKCKHFRNVARE